MACLDKMNQLVHKVLDQEATESEEETLYEHIDGCHQCKQHFYELKQTEALVKGLDTESTTGGFTQSVINQLPQRKSKPTQMWMKHHPLVTAAAFFIILMSGYLFSLWNQAPFDAVVQGEGQVEYDGHTVIVPKGEVIKGDLIVKNGRAKIEGEVQGNVILINSEPLLASAGHVTGNIEQVNQMMEWLWYHIKSFFHMFVSFNVNTVNSIR